MKLLIVENYYELKISYSTLVNRQLKFVFWRVNSDLKIMTTLGTICSISLWSSSVEDIFVKTQ